MESSIWTEKYRPHTFEEIKGQQEIIKRIKAFVDQQNLPHMLLAGPAGVGKSTTALVIARTLYGDQFRQNFLELNASDERGIDVVRVKVKDFARTRSLGNVPFKVIFLDECDSLTKEAQQALRRTMENYTQTCRFVLSCNYSSKIIDPIQSRCAVFRFKPLPQEDVEKLMDTIAKKEGLKIDAKTKHALYEVSGGDCRRMENVLQACAALKKDITEDDIYAMASVARPKEILDALSSAAAGKFIPARDKLLDTMLKYGLSGLDVIKQIQKAIWDLDVPDRKKVQIIDKCGESEFRMVEGADAYVQLEAFLAFIVYASSE